jgi:hypothetical protein
MKIFNRRSAKLTLSLVAASALTIIIAGCGQAEIPTASAAPGPRPIAEATTQTAATQLKPATFTVTDLIVDPQRVNPGEEVTATAVVVNSGEVSGTYGFGLMVDGKLTSIKQVLIRPGESVTISSPVSKDVSGVHTLNVGQMQSRFEVIPAITKPLATQSTGLPSCCAPGAAGQPAASSPSLPSCCAPGATSGAAPTSTPTATIPKASCCG